MVNGDQALAADGPAGASSASDNVLDQDVGCPGCGYNLRGLGGDVVDCPECGLGSDVAKLLTRRWNKPWYKAPGYTPLCLPVAWAICGGGFTMLLVVALGVYGAQMWLIPTGWFVIVLAVWAVLLTWIGKTYGGWPSVGFALIAHVAFGLYLAAVFMVVGGILGAAFTEDPGGRLIGVLALVAGIALFVAGRALERAVAGYCIRRYLRRLTTS